MKIVKMASAANKTPILRQIATRGYAAQASAKAAVSQGSVEITKLENQMVVASAESSLPISRVSVLFKAGSRYEGHDNLGASHILRIASSMSNRNSSQFGVMRNIQQTGGSLSCTSDREILEYSIELTRDKLDTGLKFLEDVSTGHLFKPWELAENYPRLKGDLARVTPQTRAVDLLHRAAFRTGLGNSIFCAKHHVGKLSPETLQHYVANNCKSNRAAVVGVGIDHQLLVGYAKNLGISSGGTDASSQSKFNSGDLRVDKHGDWAHVAIGTQGASLANPKDALAFAVLQQIVGNGISAKRGNVGGIAGRSVSGALGNDVFGLTALNATYSDNGLFGVVISAQSKNIGKAIDAAIKSLKQGNLSRDDIARGKQQLKTAVLYNLESESNLLSDIGAQALLLGNVQNASDIVAAIDAISDSDINSAATKVAGGKWAIGAVGNLGNVPYTNEL